MQKAIVKGEQIEQQTTSNLFRILANRLRNRHDRPRAVLQKLLLKQSSDTTSYLSSDENDDHDAEDQSTLQVHDPLLPHLLSAIKDYQLTHGSLVSLVLPPSIRNLPLPYTVLANPMGVSLLPTLWPRERFDEAWELQTLLQRLYVGVASCPEYLYEVLRDVIRTGTSSDDSNDKWSDEIVTALWNVYVAVHNDSDGLGYVQDIELGICRGDWMLHMDDEESLDGRVTAKPTLMQVELNAIATAGISHSNIVYDMHRHLLRTGIYSPLLSDGAPEVEAEASDQQRPSTSLPRPPPDFTIPPHNNAISGIVKALAQAHALYGAPKSTSTTTRRTAILMVVQHDNVNIADERPIEYALWDSEPSVPFFRCEYQDILSRTWVASTGSKAGRSGCGRELLFSPFAPYPYKHHSAGATKPDSAYQIYEISVLYLRSSLSASELLPGPPFNTRLQLERSSAIKCPSVLGQLAACKRVQWHLSLPGVMDRFLNAQDANRLRERSMLMESLGDLNSMGRMVLERIVSGSRRKTESMNCELDKYVLKPISAEGGGHNYFGEVIGDFYRDEILQKSSQAGYILMERINAPLVRGALISQQGYYVGDVVSELGVLGAVIWSRGGRSAENAVTHDPEADVNADEENETGGDGAGDRPGASTTTDVEHDKYQVRDKQAGKIHRTPEHEPKPPQILLNEATGYTLKSKPPSINEMSVIKGYGCFDTPALVEWETYNTHVRPRRRQDMV